MKFSSIVATAIVIFSSTTVFADDCNFMFGKWETTGSGATQGLSAEHLERFTPVIEDITRVRSDCISNLDQILPNDSTC